jgi:trimethylamine--corrinoid protein Co-methyltransferase
LSAGRCYFGTGADCLYVSDLETGQRRPSVKQDVVDVVRLADALPNMDFVMSGVGVGDVPPHAGHVHAFDAIVRNTTKPAIPGCGNIDEQQVMIDMAAAVAGGYEVLREKPSLVFAFGTLEPFGHEALSKAFRCAEYGIPMVYTTGSSLGSQAPVTMAGALVQYLASALPAWATIQLRYPGAKIIGGGVINAFDMQYGTPTYGAPETILSQMALGDICRYLDIPSFGFAGATDAKVLDAQAGMEYAYSLYFTARAGKTLIHDCGYMDMGKTFSLEGVLFADEIIGQVRKYLSPIEISPETLALEAIEGMEPGGTYLTHEHTYEYFRDALWFPRHVFRGSHEMWESQGKKEVRERLNEGVRQIRSEHEVPEISDWVDKALIELVDDFTRRSPILPK